MNNRLVRFFLPVALLAALVLAGCETPEAEPYEPDENAHIGHWISVGSAEAATRVSFTDDGWFTMGAGDGELEGEYKIDYREDPIVVDVITDEERIPMIIAFRSENEMLLKAPEDSEGSRPEHFESEPGKTLVELEREN